MNPLVSVILPSFNTALFIDKALDSLLAQTYTNWEALVVDDASSDESVEIIKRYAKKDSRLKPHFFATNQGVSKVRNLAITNAQGRFIAFLDSDDVWESHKLEIQVRTMLERDIALSYSPYWTINEKGEILGAFTPKASLSYEDVLKTCDIGNSTAMYDTQKLGKIQSGTIRHDYELWLRILKTHKAFIAPPPTTI